MKNKLAECFEPEDLKSCEELIQKLVDSENFTSAVESFFGTTAAMCPLAEATGRRVDAMMILAKTGYIVVEALNRRAALGKTTEGVEKAMAV